jgi:hypothetical protein
LTICPDVEENTVTAAPPPWGFTAIDRTFTPIVAQSSEEASLSKIGVLTLCGVTGAVDGDPPLPPLPHAARLAASTNPIVRLRVFDVVFMTVP